MFFKKKVRKIEERINARKVARPPYDRRKKPSPISAIITIVNRNQGNYFVNQFQEAGASLSMVLFGYSMPPQEIVNVLGVNETRKDIVLSIGRQSDIPKMKEIAMKRFIVSKESKGVLFATPLNGVAGIAVYKYLSDENREVRETKMNDTAETKNETIQDTHEMKDTKDYSLVLAIVNKGNTDLVMEAARKAGAKGGTITVARGTGNPDLAKEYGIVIQPEKEMVFIVTPNEIKDKVMKAVYDEAGISAKGMGIVISLPISDTIGLDGAHEEYSDKDEA